MKPSLIAAAALLLTLPQGTLAAAPSPAFKQQAFTVPEGAPCAPKVHHRVVHHHLRPEVTHAPLHAMPYHIVNHHIVKLGVPATGCLPAVATMSHWDPDAEASEEIAAAEQPTLLADDLNNVALNPDEEAGGTGGLATPGTIGGGGAGYGGVSTPDTIGAPGAGGGPGTGGTPTLVSAAPEPDA